MFDKYDTGYENCFELANEIYVFIMTPKRNSGLCKLEEFKGISTLTYWLRTVVKNYCCNIYEKKINTIPIDSCDRFSQENESLSIDFRTLNMDDVQAVLNLMKNERYRKLIQYRYIEDKSNEITAHLLDMTMDNYYNKHKLAKAQFCAMLRKEGLI
jgi:DNA-directed RNA polymerase specialized sigma24 family protein